MSRIRLCFAWILMSLFFAQTVSSHEFANIVGNDATTAASRQASAQILEAIGDLVAAIRSRELQQGPGTEDIKSAIGKLREAANMMEAVLGLIDDQPRLSRDQIALLDSIAGEYLATANALRPNNIQELYRIFIDATREFAAFLEKFSGTSITEPIYPQIAPALTQYLRLAEAVTRLGKTL